MNTSAKTLEIPTINTCLAIDIDEMSFNDAIAVMKHIAEVHGLVSHKQKIVFGRYTPDAPKTLLIKDYRGIAA
jgi:hypothetical protein